MDGWKSTEDTARDTDSVPRSGNLTMVTRVAVIPLAWTAETAGIVQSIQVGGLALEEIRIIGRQTTF